MKYARYALFFAVVGCSSSSSPAASSSSTTTDAGGGNTGGTTQVSGTVDGNAWQGISADLTAAKLGNDITRIKISTADACTDSGSNVLELDLPATPAMGTFTVTGGGTPPAAIFNLPAGNNTVEELVTSGTIIITNVTSSEIDGSVDLTLSTTTQKAEGSLQGTFSAPLCGN
jgi:hypothetical protein